MSASITVASRRLRRRINSTNEPHLFHEMNDRKVLKGTHGMASFIKPPSGPDSRSRRDATRRRDEQRKKCRKRLDSDLNSAAQTYSLTNDSLVADQDGGSEHPQIFGGQITIMRKTDVVSLFSAASAACSSSSSVPGRTTPRHAMPRRCWSCGCLASPLARSFVRSFAQRISIDALGERQQPRDYNLEKQ